MIRGLLIISLCSVSSPLQACDLAGASRIGLDGAATMLYRIKSPPFAVAQHFAMQFRFCRGEQSLTVKRFELDALMPAHNHAMNYRARIDILDDGLIEASGLLFHMPGQWQVVVDVEYGGTAQQLKIDYQI